MATVRFVRLVVLFLVAVPGACALHDTQHHDPPVQPAQPEPVEPTAPPAPEQYVVQLGDTLYAIAWEQGLDYLDLAAWNHIGPPHTIYPGQTIYLKAGLAPISKPVPATAAEPAAEQTTSEAATGPMPSPGRYQTQNATNAGPSKATPAEPVITARSAEPPVATAPETESRSAPQPPPPKPAPQPTPRTATGDPVWQWPTVGTVTSTFSAGDSSRQGVDIRGREGQSVLAAAGGEVVYSGNGLIGYGELIIIKHDDTWLSAYGNNRLRKVAEGVRVSAGQSIAEMGAGNGAQAELHFEIRRKGKPVDPLRLLPGR